MIATAPPIVAWVVTGPVIWHGHAVACRECGETDLWTLTIERPSGVDGELAWATCGAGHRVQHPLVYPELVARAARWARLPDPDTDQLRQLRDWEPHWLALDSTGDAPKRRPVYRSWTEPGPVDWDQEWPELVEASTAASDPDQKKITLGVTALNHLLLLRLPTVAWQVRSTPDNPIACRAWSLLLTRVERAADMLRAVLKTDGPPRGHRAQARTQLMVHLALVLDRFTVEHRHQADAMPDDKLRARAAELAATVRLAAEQITRLRPPTARQGADRPAT